jgi:rhamnopyranosyl-N-acetylglucosaminyl-diphospho-decaprenol beta-1,3/1,4-galactofuranosyltransferase
MPEPPLVRSNKRINVSASTKSLANHSGRQQRACLACVIVTYNRADQLATCLDKTLNEEVDLVVVIDNASTDSTQALLANLQEKEPRLLVERQRRNRGGAWGFARGMRLADRMLGRQGWILLFDDDSWPDSGCIDRFRASLAKYHKIGIAAVGAAVFAADGRAVEANRPVLNLFRKPTAVLRLTAPHSRSFRDLYHVPNKMLASDGLMLDVDSISFVGLFLNLEALPAKRARYPRGALFIYSDDTTYTLQLGMLGLRIILDTDLIFRHDTIAGGASTPWLRPVWKHYYVVRNSFLMNQALSHLWYVPLCFATVLIHTLKGLLLLWREQDRSLLTMVRLGVCDGMRNYYCRRQEELMSRCESTR